MQPSRYLLPIVAVLWLAATHVAVAQGRAIEDFYGSYAGQSISGDDARLSHRDLSVTIAPLEKKKKQKKGFSIEWTTVVHKDGAESRKTYKVEFGRSGRPGIYQSASRKDLFGRAVPHDPMHDEPYIWSRIRGATLTVYAMHVLDDGGYEMQVYDRTLTEAGMDLTFSRQREGRELKKLSGKLTRQAE